MAMERCGAEVAYGPFHDAFSLAVANFNHDGAVDIVSRMSPRAVYFSQREMAHSDSGIPLVFPTPSFTLLRIFNRDHNLDLACAFNTGKAIQLLTPNGHGKFTLRSSFAAATTPIALAAADLNGDGIP